MLSGNSLGTAIAFGWLPTSGSGSATGPSDTIQTSERCRGDRAGRRARGIIEMRRPFQATHAAKEKVRQRFCLSHGGGGVGWWWGLNQPSTKIHADPASYVLQNSETSFGNRTSLSPAGGVAQGVSAHGGDRQRALCGRRHPSDRLVEERAVPLPPPLQRHHDHASLDGDHVDGDLPTESVVLLHHRERRLVVRVLEWQVATGQQDGRGADDVTEGHPIIPPSAPPVQLRRVAPCWSPRRRPPDGL